MGDLARWLFGQLAMVAILSTAVAQSDTSSAKILHVIIISDVDDRSIGESVKENNRLIKTYTKDIAQDIGYDINIYEFIDNKFNSDTVIPNLRQIETGLDDIVWCFYSGHGINSGKDIWPSFLMPGVASLSIQTLTELLNNKNQRLLILQADCCNYGRFNTKNISSSNPIILPIGHYVAQSPVMFHLFTQFTGIITMSAAKSGQNAEYMPYAGGVFTNCFFEQLFKYESVAQLDPLIHNWHTILNQVSRRTLKIAQELNRRQEPQIEVNLTKRRQL